MTLANSTPSRRLSNSPCCTRSAKLPAVRGAEKPSSTSVSLDSSCTPTSTAQRWATCRPLDSCSDRTVQSPRAVPPVSVIMTASCRSAVATAAADGQHLQTPASTTHKASLPFARDAELHSGSACTGAIQCVLTAAHSAARSQSKFTTQPNHEAGHRQSTSRPHLRGGGGCGTPWAGSRAGQAPAAAPGLILNAAPWLPCLKPYLGPCSAVRAQLDEASRRP